EAELLGLRADRVVAERDGELRHRDVAAEPECGGQRDGLALAARSAVEVVDVGARAGERPRGGVVERRLRRELTRGEGGRRDDELERRAGRVEVAADRAVVERLGRV